MSISPVLTSTQEDHQQTSPDTGLKSPQGSSNASTLTPETGSKSPESHQGSSCASKLTPDRSYSTHKCLIEGQEDNPEIAVSPPMIELTATDESILRNETGQGTATWAPRY
jgi:hypothetical protein